MASRGLWHFMSARARRSLALTWSALFVLSLLLQYFSFAVATPVDAYVGPAGGSSTLFELDGNAVDNSASGLPDDWDRVFANTDGADSALFITDGFNLNDDIFTGGGSKDISAISSWSWKIGSVQDKDDIENAFAAAYTGSDGHTYVYFGLDRYQTSGDATAGFWFLKSGVAKAANGSFSGAHVEGDVLVVLDFSNGGSTASAQIYTWHNGALTAGASGTGCTTSTVQDVCAIANIAAAASPWVYDDKGAAGADNDFPANALFEGGIDLTDLQLDSGCFSTFIAETRSSNSETSTLSDLAMGQFSLCVPPEITTQVKKDGQSTGSNGHITIGESVTDSVHITGSKGTPTGTVEFFSCFNASSTPNCATGGTSRGTKTLVGGDATSNAFTPAAVGNYCFRVEYTPATGSHYLPGSHTNSTTECFVVDKQPTSISTSANESVAIGDTIHDSAVLTGATADATGTITFNAYGPGAGCGGTAAFTATAPVVGGQTNYGPVSFTPTTAGVYHWIASYGGDAKNLGSTGACLATGENDTVAKVTPSISTVASSPNGITVGGTITDTATVTGGHSPTGTVTFRLYGPNNATCAGAAIFTSADRPLSGGSATSTAFTTTQVGTYRWIATYNGDANNESVAGVCNDANEAVVVNKTNPTIVTTLVGGGESGAHITVPLGTAVHDTSVLNGATATAGGNVHYQVFDNANCTGTPIEAGNPAVVNHVPGNSDPITFNHAGTFYWQADYSGDANNNSATSNCILETVTLDKDIPTITTNASPNVTVGGSVSDTATLAGGFNPHGSITFNLYDNETCTGVPVFTSTVAVDGNHDYASGSFTTTHAGTYHWIAIYSGDLDNAGVQGDCGDTGENVVVSPATPTVTTNASAPVIVGGAIHDTATLSGGFNPTGTIVFTLFDNATCAGAPLFTSTIPVNLGNHAYDSANYTTTHAGTYRWIANYSGDANNTATANACNGANENVVVSPATPLLVTSATPGAKVGDPISDTATVSGGFNPTGTVDFMLWDNATCDGTPIFTDNDVVLGQDGKATSGTFTVLHMGTYHWVASYSGDANNVSVIGACGDEGETTIVTQFAPSITTSLTSGQTTAPKLTIVFGSSVTDQATLHNASATAGGTVTYSVYDNPDCSGDPIADGGSKAVTNGIVPASNSVTFPNAGTFYWQAHYGGDAANAPADSVCTDEVVTVTTPDLDVEKLVATGGGVFGPTSTANPGDVVHYQITVHNSGDADATDVPVSDDISAILAHATYNNDCSNSCGFASETLTWTIDVDAGETVTLTFSVTLDDTFPNGTTHLPNVVVVTGPGSNCPEASEDADCDTDTTVSTSSLVIEKDFTGNTGGIDPDLGVPAAKIGDTLTYGLHYTGAGQLTGAVITDVLPVGLVYVAGSGEAGDDDSDFTFAGYDSTTRTLTWNGSGEDGSIPDPADGIVTYQVTVPAAAAEEPQPLINTATIDSDQTGPDTDTASVAVLAPPEELTPPPTSTLTPESAPSNPGFALMLILLGVAGLTLGIGFVTPVPERVRRRNRLG